MRTSWKAAAVAALCIASSATATQAALVSQWTFDTNFTDSVGGRNLTAIGDAGISVSSRVGAGALKVDGIDDRAVFDVTGADALSGTFTLAMFVNEDADGTFFGTRSPSEMSFDAKFGGGKIHGDIGTGSAWLNTSADSGPYFPVAGQWYHIAYVVTPTTWTIYADGAQVGAGTLSGGTPLLFDQNHDIAIGAVGIGGGEYFKGRIDDVRIYNTALTQPEVRALVPEPTTLGLLAFGMLGLAGRRRR